VSVCEAVPGVVVELQIEHGQALDVAVVVNDHDVEVITLPARSAVPLTVAVYVLETRSAAFGWSVAVSDGAS
jgi:hypothetical protein